VKKNSLSDNRSKSGTKGFYAALGISAVMIGSACFFAHNQGEKLPDRKSSLSQTAVDKKSDNIPKTTGYSFTVTTTPATQQRIIVTTQAPTKPKKVVTLPAAEIVKDVSAEAVTDSAEKKLPVSTDKLENVNLPLKDCSNVLSPYSGGELVKNATTGAWETHNGTDLKAEVGAEVYAVSAGEITSISNDPLWGVTVVLDHHNGYVTRYCSLGSDLAVQEGDTISGGDLIGVVGNTADIESAAEPHLHFEIKHNGKYIDPLSVLNT